MKRTSNRPGQSEKKSRVGNFDQIDINSIMTADIAPVKCVILKSDGSLQEEVIILISLKFKE